MTRIISSLQDIGSGVDREIGSKYDDVKTVADNIENVTKYAKNITTSLKYLGPATVFPTTRLDGSAIEDGDYYLDTETSSLVYFRSASNNWLTVNPEAVISAADASEAYANAAATSEAGAVSQASAAATSAAEALASKTAAETSANASAVSEMEAATSAGTASTQATNAANSATNAATSATAASVSATSAATDATAASNSAVAAATAESTATTKAAAASTSASEAATSKEASETAASASETSATNAETYKNLAEGHATAAENSATSASTSADTATTSMNAASTHSADALGHKNSAATSATNAANSATSASTSETNAANSASAAAASEGNATNSAAAAATSESNAASSASDSAGSAVTAAAEADRAQGYADSIQDLKNVMTKAEFFALAEQRKSQSAGGGFLEWGKHDSAGSPVNTGISAPGNTSNDLFLGRSTSRQEGDSRTEHSVVTVDGVALVLNGVNTLPSDFSNVHIKFSPAPDGTKTYNSTDGTVTQHASAAIAFAAETATNKVITSRQDLVFLECFHEKISDKGVVYPLGNVQYGASTYEGVALATNGIAQGYSAFGEWDSTTTGNCAVWANLTDAEKAIFTQNPENNIYSDDGELIQVRYRVRVVEGLGDNWSNVSHTLSQLGYASSLRVAIQGYSTVSPAWVASGSSNHFYGMSGVGNRNIGEFTAYSGIGAAINAHNGLCFAIPIALVQRRNQGAYHPAWNPHGTAYSTDGIDLNNRAFWFNTASAITSTQDAFSYACTNANANGALATTTASGGNYPRPDGKFFDAIYASDVNDLRMSSVKKTANEIRKLYKRKAIASEVRGFEGVPFTDMYSQELTASNAASSVIAVDFAQPMSHLKVGDPIGLLAFDGTTWQPCRVAAVVSNVRFNLSHVDGVTLITRQNGASTLLAFEYQTHKQAKPTWTGIIGVPANIAATFPDGVEGQWIPIIPDNSAKYAALNRKVSSTLGDILRSGDSGASWYSTSWAGFTYNSTDNNLFANFPAGEVLLCQYETQAHFTQDDVNSEVLDLGGVFATSWNNPAYGAGLVSSLISKVPTWASVGTKGVNWSAELTEEGVRYLNKFDIAIWGYPSHAPIMLTSQGVTAKALDYLSSENSIAKLCFAYKEMVYDTTWGDNNMFEIASNQNTMTDDNGNTVLHGTASFNTQYFVSEE